MVKPLSQIEIPIEDETIQVGARGRDFSLYARDFWFKRGGMWLEPCCEIPNNRRITYLPDLNVFTIKGEKVANGVSTNIINPPISIVLQITITTKIKEFIAKYLAARPLVHYIPGEKFNFILEKENAMLAFNAPISGAMASPAWTLFYPELLLRAHKVSFGMYNGRALIYVETGHGDYVVFQSKLFNISYPYIEENNSEIIINNKTLKITSVVDKKVYILEYADSILRARRKQKNF